MKFDNSELIKFLASWKKWRSKRDLFYFISSFVLDHGLAQDVIFFRTTQESKHSSVRQIWSSASDQTLPQELLSENNLSQLIIDNRYYDYSKNKQQLIFLLGNDSRYYYWGYFKIERKWDTEFSELFFSYIHHGFTLLMEFTDRNRLLNLTYIDDVTGFYNQRKLHKDLQRLIRTYKQDQVIFSVLFVDIDHFKQINDNYGHVIGSALLRDMAQQIRILLRDDDLLYRYGGDEFVLILPRTDHKQATLVGNRIISQIKGHTFIFKEHKFNLSVSIGVAQFPVDAATSESILELADKMMYEAKKQGRGKVCSAKELFIQQGGK